MFGYYMIKGNGGVVIFSGKIYVVCDLIEKFRESVRIGYMYCGGYRDFGGCVIWESINGVYFYL